MRIGLTRELPGEGASRLREVFASVDVFPGSVPPTRQQLEQFIADKEVLIILLTEKIDADLLRCAPNLKCLITYSVGLDHIQISALKARKIQLSHTPAVLTDATADLAWALVLACSRLMKPAMEYLTDGKFFGVNAVDFLGTELNESRFGIFGMGRIGRAVAKRAHAFGCEVVYFDYKQRKFPEGKLVSKGELIKTSDILSLHCPLTPETRHWISQAELSQMRPDAVLVNVARGPVIDEAALESHLRQNSRFRAGLDVYEKEPEVSKGLRALPNAVCLPHIGSATVKTRRKMADICVQEAIRFAKGERLQYEYRN